MCFSFLFIFSHTAPIPYFASTLDFLSSLTSKPIRSVSPWAQSQTRESQQLCESHHTAMRHFVSLTSDSWGSGIFLQQPTNCRFAQQLILYESSSIGSLLTQPFSAKSTPNAIVSQVDTFFVLPTNVLLQLDATASQKRSTARLFSSSTLSTSTFKPAVISMFQPNRQPTKDWGGLRVSHKTLEPIPLFRTVFLSVKPTVIVPTVAEKTSIWLTRSYFCCTLGTIISVRECRSFLFFISVGHVSGRSRRNSCEPWRCLGGSQRTSCWRSGLGHYGQGNCPAAGAKRPRRSVWQLLFQSRKLGNGSIQLNVSEKLQSVDYGLIPSAVFILSNGGVRFTSLPAPFRMEAKSFLPAEATDQPEWIPHDYSKVGSTGMNCEYGWLTESLLLAGVRFLLRSCAPLRFNISGSGWFVVFYDFDCGFNASLSTTLF